MKRFAEQLNKQASSLRLKAAERRELKDRLVAYMEYHPLPAEMRQTESVKPTETEFVSEPFWAFNFDMTIMRSFAGVFVLILIVVIPMMAEKSVPGDALYPVKVQFNEEVRSSLSISPYAQVEWETTRLERRLAEARLLASEGKLTNEFEADVALAVKEHSNNAKASIAKIRENDEDDAVIAEINFASALAVQSEVLEGHVESEIATEGQEGRSIATIVYVVSEEQQAAEATQAGVTPSYTKLLGRVEAETTRAYELFASVSDYASAEEVANIERRLADIERKLNKAIALHDGQPVLAVPEEVATEIDPVDSPEVDQVSEEESASESTTEVEDSLADEEGEEVAEEGSEVTDDQDANETEVLEASDGSEEVVDEESVELAEVSESSTEIITDEQASIVVLREVLVDTKKLISFMTNIDVRNNVSIDKLLPVTLTDDEKVKQIKNTVSEAKSIEIKLNDQAVSNAVNSKFAIGMEKLAGQLEAAERALVDGNLDQAMMIADEALLIATDLQTYSVNAKPIVKDEDPFETVVEEGTDEEVEDEVTEETGTENPE